MKTLKTFTIIALTFGALAYLETGCSAQRELVSQRSGAQIWGENCVRCHNSPSPADYNDTDWETIGMHMRVRANLTREEIDKVVDFLKSAN